MKLKLKWVIVFLSVICVMCGSASATVSITEDNVLKMNRESLVTETFVKYSGYDGSTPNRLKTEEVYYANWDHTYQASHRFISSWSYNHDCSSPRFGMTLSIVQLISEPRYYYADSANGRCSYSHSGNGTYIAIPDGTDTIYWDGGLKQFTKRQDTYSYKNYYLVSPRSTSDTDKVHCFGCGVVYSNMAPTESHSLSVASNYSYTEEKVYGSTGVQSNTFSSWEMNNCSSKNLDFSGNGVVNGGNYNGTRVFTSAGITVNKGTIISGGNAVPTFLLGEDSEQTVVKDGSTTITTVKLSNPPPPAQPHVSEVLILIVGFLV